MNHLMTSERPVCVLPSLASKLVSRFPHRVARVCKLQRRMTAGARESLASAAPASELYNPQARASGAEDDLVSDSIGTLRQAWRRPGAAAHGGGVDASQHHLAFPARVQWFSACLVMLSLGAVELVVPNTLGAGLMAPLSTSAEFLASAPARSPAPPLPV